MQGVNPIVLMVVMFAMFYFLMIRPQAKRQKEHRAMLDRLATNDLVITRGGMIGRVVSVAGDVLVLEIQDQVRCAVPRSYVDGKWDGRVPEALRQALREPA
jgi:preprotein translocase subunit YajC